MRIDYAKSNESFPIINLYRYIKYFNNISGECYKKEKKKDKPKYVTNKILYNYTNMSS